MRRNTEPIDSNVLDALTDMRSTREENIIFDRRHYTETKRTDHFNLRIEISCFVKESAQGAWYEKETYQKNAD